MNILDFGAVRGAFSGEAIQRAIDAAAAQGGGRVTVPAGVFETAGLVLRSNVELHLESGAVLRFTDDFDAYPIIRTRWEGFEQDSHRPLIYAKGEENIALTGCGTLEGCGRKWWTAFRAGEMKAARPCFICFENCSRVLMEGFKVTNSPAWTVHPLCCENVTIHGLTVVNPSDSPNTDGINPESCQNVHISNCHIDVGDDCITLKAGQETEPMINSRPCENITVTNCTMLHGHGGVVIGSEMSGGVHNVVITNCVFLGTERGIRIKTRRKRGGSVTDVLADNILMKDVYAPITMNGFYRWGIGPGEERLLDEAPMPVDDKTPVMENIRLSNILSLRTKLAAMYIIGLPERPIRGLNFNNVTVEMENPERIQDIAVSIINRPLCCLNGVNVENVENVQISGFTVRGQEGPAYTFKNCRNLTFDGRKVDETEEIF